MIVSQELLKHCLKLTADSKNQASDLAALLDKYNGWNRKRLEFAKKREDAKKVYQIELQRIAVIEEVAQAKCDHPVTTTRTDPVDNRNSYTQCDICGKVL